MVTRQAAGRFLIRRSGLGRRPSEPPPWPGPGDTLAAVRALEYVQVDPMAVLARSPDLVLGARVEGYSPAALDDLLYHDRSLVEVVGRERMIVPVEDYHLFAARFRLFEREERPRLADLEPVMSDVLARVEAEGPLSSLDFDDDRRISGWWDADDETATKAVRQAMEWLWHFGRLAISRREGLRRYFDLPERVLGDRAAPLPEYRPPQPPGASARLRDPAGDGAAADDLARYQTGAAAKYCRAMGLSNPRAWHFGWSKRPVKDRVAAAMAMVASGDLVPVEIEGVETTYLVPAAEATDLGAAGSWEPEPEVRFLPPLDNLVWDRDRLAAIFGFDYTWEAYVPPAKRKYGPYTCPILWGDILAGRIDARIEREKPRKKGAPATPAALVVNQIWWEPRAKKPSARVFRTALETWARLNGASEVVGL